MNVPKSPVKIELSKSAIIHNIHFIRKLIGNEINFTAVVKGNAYGHGIETYCKIAFDAGVKQFCTYSAYEAYRVWKITKGKSKILIMGHIDTCDLEWVIGNKIEFFVFNYSRVIDAIETARKIRKKAL